MTIPLGNEREILLPSVAPWWSLAKGGFLRKDVPFGPGCKFLLAAGSRPLGGILLALAGVSQKILHPPHAG
jgi:hypothetical protein